ncbi:very short patch repair endonuclease [Streptomyces sp. NPDC001494]
MVLLPIPLARWHALHTASRRRGRGHLIVNVARTTDNNLRCRRRSSLPGTDLASVLKEECGRSAILVCVSESRESWASTPGTRASMQANRSRDTRPELALRRAVHALGLRYRVATRPIPTLRRTADLVFPRQKVAVFLDGCFWHGCPEHHTKAARNSDYWQAKVRRNRERDLDTTERLAAAGWLVLRFWEHEDLAAAALVVQRAVYERRART